MEYVLTIAALSYLPPTISSHKPLTSYQNKDSDEDGETSSPILAAKRRHRQPKTECKKSIGSDEELPKPQKWIDNSDLCMFFFFAGMGTVMRPTNALIWIPCVLDLLNSFWSEKLVTPIFDCIIL